MNSSWCACAIRYSCHKYNAPAVTTAKDCAAKCDARVVNTVGGPTTVLDVYVPGYPIQILGRTLALLTYVYSLY